MKTALIGGTGFVGSYVVDELVANQHEPVLLVRPGSESRVEHRSRCKVVSGDVNDIEALRETLDGCHAAIYNIGILRESPDKGITFDGLQFRGARDTIDTAVASNVERFILMSANGVKADGTPYQQSKYHAEQHLESTDLNYTIFRPSIIFGEPRGRMEFCTQLRDEMITMPIPAPLFFEGLLPRGAGTFKLSPVHVRDVAKVFVKSLTTPETSRKTFGLGGPDALMWKEIIQIIARACGKANKLAVPVPAFHVRVAAMLLDRFEFFPITRDQLNMLLEGNICDSSALFALMSLEPTPFNEAALAYLRNE